MEDNKHLFVIIIIAIIFIAAILLLSFYEGERQTIKGDVRFVTGKEQPAISESPSGRTTTGTVTVSGTESDTETPSISDKFNQYFDKQGYNSGQNVPQNVPNVPIAYNHEYDGFNTGAQVIIMSPYELTRMYDEAKLLVENSRCFLDIADLREITYYTGWTGEKYAGLVIPNSDYTMFKVMVSVKLKDKLRHTVFYEEVPVIVDVRTGSIAQCPPPMKISI